MRYLIFGGEAYYASGGGFDLLYPPVNGGSEAARLADNAIGQWAMTTTPVDPFPMGTRIEWAHVMDSHTGEIVYRVGVTPYGGGDRIIHVQPEDPWD